MIASVERAGLGLFASVRSAILAASNGEPRVPLPEGLFDHPDRQTAWFKLDSALEDLARAAEAESEPAVHPYVIGAVTLVLLMVLLLAVVSFGGGREHS